LTSIDPGIFKFDDGVYTCYGVRMLYQRGKECRWRRPSETDQTQYNIVLLPLIFALLWIKYIAKLKLDLKRPDRIFHQYNFCWKLFKAVFFSWYIFVFISTKCHMPS
jgi:hypothetical protein